MQEIKSQTTFIEVPGASPMQLHVFSPSREGRLPVMLLFQEAFGVNGHIRDLAKTFAENGCLVIAPEFFHRTAPPGFEGNPNDFSSITPHIQAVTPENIKADLTSLLSWIRQNPAADSDRIGAIGYCMGGRIAFMANAWFSFKAASCFYGSRIVPDHLPLAAEQKAPILFGWGGQDSHIPATQRRAINDAMMAAKKDFVEIEYASADHGFMREGPKYDAKATGQAWAATLSFFKVHGVL